MKNIIFIVFDAVRFDHFKEFPHFKSLLEKSTVFEKTITYMCQTIGSMHAMFTGIYGNYTGVNNYFTALKFDSLGCMTLPQYLQSAGYTTICDTQNEMTVPAQGFDTFGVQDEYKEDLKSKHLGMIESAAKNTKPFFLYLHYSGVHAQVMTQVIKKYSDYNGEFFSNKEKNKARYNSFLELADDYLKGVLDTFYALGLDENTLLITTADNGASLGEKKGEIGYGRLCYDYTINSFVTFLSDDTFPKKRFTKMVRTIDIMPTILERFGISVEELGYKQMQGKSLFPIIHGVETGGRIAFSENAGLVENYPTSESPRLKSIRTDDWKLIYDVKTRSTELYDLKNDPDELHNVVQDKLEIKDKLFEELKKHSSLTTDASMQEPDIKEKIRGHLDRQKKEWPHLVYGLGDLYQSFDELGIKGQRNTEQRIKDYELLKHLKKDFIVLDIGCNCGFLSLQVSMHVRHVDGVDVNPYLIDIAFDVKNHLSIKNAHFTATGFENFIAPRKYDAVFSFAADTVADGLSKLSFPQYIEKIKAITNDNALLFFESQASDLVEGTWDEKFEVIKDNFTILSQKNIVSEYPLHAPKRVFLVLKKK